MVTVFFNLLGLGMLVISATAGLMVVDILDASGEAPFMMTAGPIALACDVAYRWKDPTGHWLRPGGGGHLLFIPIWVFGLWWSVLGIAYAITGQEKSDLVGVIVASAIAVGILGVAILKSLRSTAPHSSLPESMDWQCTRCGHQNGAGTPCLLAMRSEDVKGRKERPLAASRPAKPRAAVGYSVQPLRYSILR